MLKNLSIFFIGGEYSYYIVSFGEFGCILCFFNLFLDGIRVFVVINFSVFFIEYLLSEIFVNS